MATPTGKGGEDKFKDEVEWSSRCGKYKYAPYGTKAVLFVVPDGSSVQVEAVPRRLRERLTEEEADKLQNQGIAKEHQSDDLSIMKARYKVDSECEILDDMFGRIACDTFKKKITTIFNNTTKAAVVLHYIGPGKRDTGDWCLQDGFITFKDIMKIYIDTIKAKQRDIILVIVSDCSYSGSWIRECMKFMDEQGIGPCGHAAKKKGIIVQMLAACLPNEIPTELTMSTYYFKNEKNAHCVEFHAQFRTKKVSEGQHPTNVSFAQVRCHGAVITSPCTMAPGSTWSRWMMRQRVFLQKRSRSLNNVAHTEWRYVLLVDDDKTICELAVDEDISEQENIEEYGKILMAAVGDEVPNELEERLESSEYAVNYSCFDNHTS